MRPSIYGEVFFDDLIDQAFRHPIFGKREKILMKTDIKEEVDKYVLDMDLPGFCKDNVQVTLKNGYLTISAEKNFNKENKTGKYIHQERYAGTCSRSFYVGENIKQEDMKAKFENGILHLEFPKIDHNQIEKSYKIEIE